MIKAILFDMDGVIFDSEPTHFLVENLVLNKFGLSRTKEEEKEQFGTSFPDIVKKYFDVDEKTYNQILDEKIKLLEEYPINTINPTEQFIKNNHNKYKFAVVSSSMKRSVDILVKNNQMEDFFTVIISRDDITNAKPDPEPYLTAAKKLNINPEEAIVVEDSPSGIKAANAAGIKCIALTTSFPKDKLTDADLIVDQLSEEAIKTVNE